ncbi:MAG: hypothetical protein ABI806_18220 [Candidatus Solibacter sp.]
MGLSIIVTAKLCCAASYHGTTGRSSLQISTMAWEAGGRAQERFLNFLERL